MYRDDHEAALQRNHALEQELAALRRERDQLRDRLDAPEPARDEWWHDNAEPRPRPEPKRREVSYVVVACILGLLYLLGNSSGCASLSGTKPRAEITR